MDDIAVKSQHDRPRAQSARPWGLLLLLMATTSIGPTSLNILVPAVPELSHQLGAPVATMQLTVSLFLVGLAFAQLVMGPLSDRFGRRPVMLAGAFGSSTFFVFLGGGPHVIVTLMGRTSAEYGLWFAVSSIGYMAGNFIASRLSMRHGIHALIRWGIAFEIVGVALSTVLAWGAADYGPAIVFVPQLVIALGNGLLLPGAISGAISVRPQAAGTAAGIIGCVQMALGAAVAQYAGAVLADATSALPMAVLMVAMVAALALSFAALVPRR